MKKYLFGTPDSSKKTETYQTESLDDALITFKTTELYPELYVRREMIECVLEERPYPYEPVLKARPDAVIEVYECPIDGKKPLMLIPISEIAEAPLAPSGRKLLPRMGIEEDAVTTTSSAKTVMEKTAAREEMDSLLSRKLELERQLNEVKGAMRMLEEKLQNAAKTLRLMKNYAGIDAEIVQIRDGSPAPEDEPLTIYQSKLFMDENVGILGLFEGGTDSLDVNNLEEFDSWIADHYKTFMPAEKALTVWQIRREAKRYALGCDAESEFFNRIMNEGNFRTYFLVRNGERLWRFTSDFHVPDEVFPKHGEKWDWSSESRMREDTEKRLFALAALQGVIDHTDILGRRFREKGVNLLQPVPSYDGKDIVFVRDAEPGQYITDGMPCWRNYLKANQEDIKKGSRIMPIVGYSDIAKDDGWGNKWNIVRSTNSRCGVYTAPDVGEIYTVEDIGDSYWSSDSIKILFNPKDEVYRYQGNWVSNHERMMRIGFRYFRDEVIDVDAVTFENITYYLNSRIDRPYYITMLPLLARLWKWKKKEHDEETPFAMLLASKAGLEWPEDEERVRSVIHWWKTKNRMRRAVTKDDALAFRMCLKRLKDVIVEND